MQEDFRRQPVVLDRELDSVATVMVQLSELSCRIDRLEEHWNDPEAVRSRLGQLAAARPAAQLSS